jgi:hypothetical protein
MVPRAFAALAVAGAELGGPVIRTAASVIGTRGGESVIVATTSWSYSVTVMAQGMPLAFTIRPRGLLRRALAVSGAPHDLVSRVVDPQHLARIQALAPSLVELGPTALRLEHKHGPAEELVEAIQVAVSLVRRARGILDDSLDAPLAHTG